MRALRLPWPRATSAPYTTLTVATIASKKAHCAKVSRIIEYGGE